MIDKELTEYFGKCWHKGGAYGNALVCRKCNYVAHGFRDNVENCNYPLSTPEGFFWLWEKCKESGWWRNFITGRFYGRVGNSFDNLLNTINYSTFPQLVYDFLKETKRI